MMAALDTKNLPENEDVNRRLLLTKDTLQQHECVLSSNAMRKLFTHWQAFHQVPFSIIKEDHAYRVYLHVSLRCFLVLIVHVKEVLNVSRDEALNIIQWYKT